MVDLANPAAMTERLIDAAIYNEQASGGYVAGARKELNDARAEIEKALSRLSQAGAGGVVEAQEARKQALLALYRFVAIAAREKNQHVRSPEFEAADQAAVDAITKLAALAASPSAGEPVGKRYGSDFPGEPKTVGELFKDELSTPPAPVQTASVEAVAVSFDEVPAAVIVAMGKRLNASYPQSGLDDDDLAALFLDGYRAFTAGEPDNRYLRDKIRSSVLRATSDELDGNANGDIIVKGCVAAGYDDPEDAASRFVDCIRDEVLATILDRRR